MSMMLAGCGKVDREDKGEDLSKRDSFIESLSEGEETEEEKTEEEELDWITLEEKFRPSVLQITCGGYTGSGVVWEITEEEVIVASSGHLLKNGESCEVVCYAGIFYEAEVDRVLEGCDIGFAVISAEALKEDGVELRAAVPYTGGKDALVPGEELAVYGSMDHVAGNFVKGYLVEAEREMLLDGYEREEGLLLGSILRENVQGNMDKGIVDAGMSGSGVFNRQGKLIGILAGGDGRQGFAAVPVWKFT